MKRIATLFVLLSMYAHASSGIFQSYVIINAGSGNTYYAGSINSDAATVFNNQALGTFNTGSTLLLVGGENKTYKNGADDIFGAKLNYRVYKNGDTPPAFTEMDLPFDSNLPSSGDQKWSKSNASINILDFVTSQGTWKIEIYWRVPYNFGDHFDNNSGSNVIATFTADATFPVELSQFTAFAKNSGVILNWQTATEINNHGFNVEKRIGSGDWSTIGFRAGQGTTNTKTDYSFTDASVSTNASYRLKQIDNDGKFHYSAEVSVKNAAIASSTELKGNYPNPFNPSTAISFTVAATGRTTVKVYDVMGKEIATVADGIYNAGEIHSVPFNASGLSSGVYFYRLVSGSTVQTRSMILMK